MSLYASKFRVLRGWKPGDISNAVDTVQAHATTGVIDTLPAGTVVAPAGDGTYAVPGSVVTAANGGITRPDIRVVFTGTDDNDSISLGGKMLVGRGNFRVQVSNLAGGSTFPVEGPVSYNTSGQFKDAGTDMIIGRVVRNDVTATGTIVIDLALN
jgi:hypothetical protein